MSRTFFRGQEEGKKEPPMRTVAADESDGLGLSINLDECYDEFTERAKVLPFVPKKAMKTAGRP